MNIANFNAETPRTPSFPRKQEAGKQEAADSAIQFFSLPAPCALISLGELGASAVNEL